MKSCFLSCCIYIFSACLLFSCHTDKSIRPIQKTHANDPFKDTMVESQVFSINGKKDHVLEGEQGTIMVFPQGCFKNAAGKIITENIDIELAEAFSLVDMLSSNLTTTSNGKQLITDGMIYFNATADGEQLLVNEEIPVYIEIPTDKRKPSMQVYKGERDENGIMNWVEPQPLETFLTAIDLSLLDFYPKGFEAAVEANMPYKNHQYANAELKDSLFYSLSYFNVIQFAKIIQEFPSIQSNEAYYNKYKEVINGQYTSASFDANKVHAEVDSIYKADEFNYIDPALIKVIRSEPFQNSLIATREFEKRLPFIYQSCHNSILEIYSKNLDKNMWELDSMVAVKIKNFPKTFYSESDMIGHVVASTDSLEKIFRDFAGQRLTNIKGSEKYSHLLKEYYDKRLKEVQLELENKHKEFIHEINKETEVFKKVAKEYKKLLFKREKYRMETYGFEWTSTGWVNVDTGTIPKDWGAKKLEVLVKNGSEYDRVHTYVIYSSIKSLYRLNSFDKEVFYVGNDSEREMLMPKKKQATIISVAYKGQNVFLGTLDFITDNSSLVVNLSPSSQKELSEILNRYDNYAAENSIEVDLKYMEAYEKERIRQRRLQEELDFMRMLFECIHVCPFNYGPS